MNKEYILISLLRFADNPKRHCTRLCDKCYSIKTHFCIDCEQFETYFLDNSLLQSSEFTFAQSLWLLTRIDFITNISKEKLKIISYRLTKRGEKMMKLMSLKVLTTVRGNCQMCCPSRDWTVWCRRFLGAKSDQTNLQTGQAYSSNFSTQATSSSDAIITDTAVVVADADK
jgi:hypothetical protein